MGPLPCRRPSYALSSARSARTFAMFSSLASLLPSALHINTNVDLPKQTVNPEESSKEDQDIADDIQTIHVQAQSDQDPAKGKEKDTKSPSEVCSSILWLIKPERECGL